MEAAKKKFTVIFRCTVPKCSYASKRRYNLHRHVKTHGKEHWRSKRFPCPCCAYAAATRTHIKRHMGNKHPDEDITQHVFTALAYEYFDTPTVGSEDEEEEPKPESDQEPEKQPKETKREPHRELRRRAPAQKLPEGPVTVLQLVTPQSKVLPGDDFCNVSLEGEAFRLIPVAFLPPEAAAEEL